MNYHVDAPVEDLKAKHRAGDVKMLTAGFLEVRLGGKVGGRRSSQIQVKKFSWGDVARFKPHIPPESIEFEISLS
jgi:hypothetical protein